ncbi:hypothetical protein C8R47DRAFT_1067477 [Mycena vitilis]|nr:hypothetical protein C8R47DRAFT_1067477 [Mycena vitilis]
MKEGNKILHSGAYWQQYHRNRAERRARQEERSLRGLGSDNQYGYGLAGALPSQPPLITFIPNRAAPVYTFVQNNGTLAPSSDPLSIRPSPAAADHHDPVLPARRDAAPAPSQIGTATHRRESVAIAARAQSRLSAKPSADELLVQRFKRRADRPAPAKAKKYLKSELGRFVSDYGPRPATVISVKNGPLDLGKGRASKLVFPVFSAGLPRLLCWALPSHVAVGDQLLYACLFFLQKARIIWRTEARICGFLMFKSGFTREWRCGDSVHTSERTTFLVVDIC